MLITTRPLSSPLLHHSKLTPILTPTQPNRISLRHRQICSARRSHQQQQNNQPLSVRADDDEKAHVVAQEAVHEFFNFAANKQHSRRLSQLCCAELSLVPDAAILRGWDHPEIKGIDAVLSTIASCHACYSRQTNTIHATATAAPSSDAESPTTVFALVSFALKDAQGTPTHAATFRVSKGFSIFQFELQDGLISRIEFKRQLTHEEIDGMLLDPVHVYPPPFPLDELVETDANRESQPQSAQQRQQAVMAAVESWVMAHSSATHLDALDTILSEDCRLLEAYGVFKPTFPALPEHISRPSPQAQQSQQDASAFSVSSALDQLHHRSRFISGPQVTALLQVLHAAYEMLSINEVTIAVDDRLNLAFASWTSTLENRCSGQTFIIREMAAITFEQQQQSDQQEPQIKLRSIWSIRDPFDFERAVLLRPLVRPAQPPQQGPSLESLLAGLVPSPGDIIHAMQHKVGTTDWTSIANSMSELASAFSAAAVAAAARAQGAPSPPLSTQPPPDGAGKRGGSPPPQPSDEAADKRAGSQSLSPPESASKQSVD